MGNKDRNQTTQLSAKAELQILNEDELLLAHIHSAHHAKACAKVITALRQDYAFTAEHKRALADFIERSIRPRTKHDRGRKKARLLDGSEADHFNRACEDVRETAKRLGYSQKPVLEILAGPRPSDYPSWDAATWAIVRAEKHGFWPQRAATLSNTRYDYSRFADQIAAKLHLD
jgi:hypothetical protein